MNNYNITYLQNNQIKKISLKAEHTSTLQKHKLYPKNILKIKKLHSFELFKIKTKVKHIDNIIDNLDILLKANIKIDEAIKLLLDTYKSNTNENIFLLDFLKNIEDGKDISSVFENSKYNISNDISSFMRLANKADNIGLIISSLNNILTKEKTIKQNIKTKFTYPFMLFVVLVFSVVFLFVVVVPKFEYIFSTFGEDLPYITVLFLKLKNNFVSFVIVLSATFIFAWLIYDTARNNYKNIKIATDKIKLFKLWFISEIVYTFEMSRLFLSISSVLKAFYKFETALNISKDATTNSYILNRIETMMTHIKKGDSIYKVFENSKLFEPFVCRLVGFSQQGSNIDKTIDKISFLYEDKLNKKVNTLSSVIEPVLIIIIGLFVLFMMLAIFVPVWELGSIIK